MTKRIFNRLLAVTLALCLMTSLLNLSVFAADGGADASAISLESGQTVDLTQQAGTTVYGQKLEAPVDPSWSSSDASIATVDQAGVVTGQAAGTVTITREGCAYWVPAGDDSDGVYSFENVTEGAQCVQATTTWTVEVTAPEVPETPEYPEETCTVDYSVRQSESVSYDGYTKTDGGFIFYYTIHGDAQGDLVIDLAKGALDLWNNETQMPGDHFKFQIFVKNESGHTYRYQDGSFVLAPEDTSEFGSIEEGSLLPVLTYDGQLMPIRLSGAVAPKYFKQLFGVSKDSQVTFEMLCQIYDYLADEGYTGENAITDYLLDYFNTTWNMNYDSLIQLFTDHPEKLDNSLASVNGIYNMSEAKLQEYIDQYPWIEPFLYVQGSGSQLEVQIKWPEPEPAVVSYNGFYTALFSVVYGQENAEKLNPNGSGVEFSRAHGVGDYLKGTDLYTETNGYFAGLTADPLQPNDTLEIWSGYGLDGPGMGNSYQNYSFTYYNTITLEQVDTSYTVRHDYYSDGKLDGSVTLDPVSGMVGDSINVTAIAQAPEYNNNTYTYTSTTPETALVLGKNADQNVIVLRYDRSNSSGGGGSTYYTLTVRYLEEGTDQVLAAPYSISKAALTYYDVTSYTDLAIEGYTISQVTGDAVTGTMNGNKEIIVYYTADEDLTDPETPLNPDPGDGDGTDIGDGEVPLNPDPGTDVPDTDVPTTDIPETGDSMGLWLALASVSAGGLAVLTLSERRKKA